MFVATNICGEKSIVVTNIILSRPKFCHKINKKHIFVDKRRVLSQQTHVCRDKTFVKTKMILVAAQPNDKTVRGKTHLDHLCELLCDCAGLELRPHGHPGDLENALIRRQHHLQDLVEAANHKVRYRQLWL